MGNQTRPLIMVISSNKVANLSVAIREKLVNEGMDVASVKSLGPSTMRIGPMFDRGLVRRNPYSPEGAMHSVGEECQVFPRPLKALIWVLDADVPVPEMSGAVQEGLLELISKAELCERVLRGTMATTEDRKSPDFVMVRYRASLYQPTQEQPHPTPVNVWKQVSAQFGEMMEGCVAMWTAASRQPIRRCIATVDQRHDMYPPDGKHWLGDGRFLPEVVQGVVSHLRNSDRSDTPEVRLM